MSALAAEVISDLLSRGHGVRFRAAGDSMHPIIRSDDELLVVPMMRIRRGDVVLTLVDRRLLAHRVVGISDDTLVTRGDNARENDVPVTRERVLGRVTHAGTRRIRRATALLLLIQRLIARL